MDYQVRLLFYLFNLTAVEVRLCVHIYTQVLYIDVMCNYLSMLQPDAGLVNPVDSPHKGQWRGALIFPLICARTTVKQTIETQEGKVSVQLRPNCGEIIMFKPTIETLVISDAIALIVMLMGDLGRRNRTRCLHNHLACFVICLWQLVIWFCLYVSHLHNVY